MGGSPSRAATASIPEPGRTRSAVARSTDMTDEPLSEFRSRPTTQPTAGHEGY
jgi:hypothetical protein